MNRSLDTLTIRGFKSIKELDALELRPLNVLIGANGAGKSNFVDFFRLLRAIVEQRLQSHVAQHGPVDGYFFNGVGFTLTIDVQLTFGLNAYSTSLFATTEGRLILLSEDTGFWQGEEWRQTRIASSADESALRQRADDRGLTARHGPNHYVYKALSSWHVYHFHDTSFTAGMRRDSGIEQTERLSPTGANLAAFLLGLRTTHPSIYQRIRSTIQRIAPYFDDFVLGVRKERTEDQVRLTWRQRGTDYIFSPGHFSDGTIRFICLVTALFQPTPPTTIVIDEPELGLHPEALAVLAGLLRSASSQTQVIVATQSPTLLSHFAPEDVITVDHVDGASQFRRLDPEALKEWLTEYSLGELWLKGNIGGGVNRA